MKDNKKIILVLFILSIIMIVLGGTLAYWNWQSDHNNDTNITLTVGSNFSCSADGGGNITNTNYFVPTDCTNSTYAIQRTITTSITNNSSDSVYLDMWLNVNSIDSGLSGSDNFKYALTTNSSSCTSDVITSGNFKGKIAGDRLDLLTHVTDGSTYYLYVWLDSEETSPDTMNQSVELSLGGECTNELPSLLFNKIFEDAVIDNISSTYVENENGIQFGSNSSDTNGKGLYIRAGTQNDTHPIYYYRGAVDNNNVLFANFCWKIVRTTETGGIKLVYNGSPTRGQCINTTGADTAISETTYGFNPAYTSLSYVGYMHGTKYTYTRKAASGLSSPYVFGGDFDYVNNQYVLKDTITSTGVWADDYDDLNSHHYTCLNATGTCKNVYYVYYTTSSYAYYITLSNNKNISTALSEMLTNSTNATNSTMKTTLDTWYNTYLANYTKYLEDTVWCNDRSISSLGGWDPDGGDTSKYLIFAPYNRAYNTFNPSLSCASKNDSFTVTDTINGNGKLDNPVALLTSDEVLLAGATDKENKTFYLYTNKFYWLLSPGTFVDEDGTGAYIFRIGSTGKLNTTYSITAGAVRPAISLVNSIRTQHGDGSSTNPYIIFTD